MRFYSILNAKSCLSLLKMKTNIEAKEDENITVARSVYLFFYKVWKKCLLASIT